MSAAVDTAAADRAGRTVGPGQVFWVVFALGVLVFLFAPIVVAGVISFSSSSSLVFPPPGWSLEWYAAILADDQIWRATGVSAVIALASTAIAVVAGTLAAVAVNHYRFAGRNSLKEFLLLPLTLPAIILGLGLLYAISLFGMRPGVTAAILGHSVISVPYVAYFVLAALANYDLTLERASLDLGAGRVRTFVRITLPMIRQGVIVGAVFAFLLSFDNISLSLFLTRGDTLPLRLLQRIQYYADPSVAAVSTGLIALSILLMLPIRGYLARSFEPRR